MLESPAPLVGALLVLVALYVVVPRLLRFVASHRGRDAFAVVTSAETTAVLDEHKRPHHRLALRVELDGQTRDVVVTQVLPASMRGTPSSGSRLAVRVLGNALAVVVVGYAPSDALVAVMEAHAAGRGPTSQP